MERLFVVVVFLLLIPINIASQSELQQTYTWDKMRRASIPSWILTADILGVSDPGLKPEIARRQALQRALFMQLLYEGIEVSSVMQYYTISNQSYPLDEVSSKLTIMMKIHQTEKHINYSVAEETSNQYGEVFIRLNTPSQNENSSSVEIACVGEFTLISTKEGRENNMLNFGVWLVTPQLDSLKETRYQLKGSTEYSICKSEINRVSNPYQKECYFYNNYQSDCSSEVYSKSNLKNSFWNADIEILLKTLALYSGNKFQVKKVDQYTENKQQDMTHEIAVQKLRVQRNCGFIQNNWLHTHWNITPVEVEK